MIKAIYLFCLLCLTISCRHKTKEKTNHSISINKNATITIVSFFEIDSIVTNSLKNQIEKAYAVPVKFAPMEKLPSSAYFNPRKRYIADSLLVFLSNKSSNTNTYYLGITDKDISTQKGVIANWGVMGLGYQPGNACIISGFRVSKPNFSNKENHIRLGKVAIHELGHNFGLPYCTLNTCYMVDAEGKDKLQDEINFCKNCSITLQSSGFIK